MPKSLKKLINGVVRLGVAATRLVPKRLWLRIQEESGRVGRLDYAPKSIYLSVDSLIENDVRLVSCAKEPDTIDWIESWFKPGDVFYDIGANVGAYSLVAHSFLNGQAKIYAFEPGFMTFPQLCKNIHLNKAHDAITPLQVALSDQEGMIAFHYRNLMSGGALHALGEAVDHHGEEFKPVFTLPTLSYRLDDFRNQFGLPNPNHIKIDVDGIEYLIVSGAKETLSCPELRTILLELNPDREDSKRLVALLEANDFVLESTLADNCVYVKAHQ